MEIEDWDKAPKECEMVPVTVVMTISKSFELPVDDYDYDENGDIDFSECDLYAAFMESDEYRDLNKWDEDEIEIIRD